MFALIHLPAGLLTLVVGMGTLFDYSEMESPVQQHATQQVAPVFQDTTKTKHSKNTSVHISTSTDDNGTRFSYNNHNGSNATELSYEGKIVFTEDERDIQSISPGGYLKYSKTTFGNTRSILIESGSNGALKRSYYVGKNEEPYEPEGRKWLTDVLPDLIATSGIGAEERVKRIYAKEGTNGVLRAVSKIESDYVKSIYFSYLLEVPSLSENDLKNILSQVTSSVSSDYEKGKLLRKVSGTYLKNDHISQQYIAAVSSMSSDYEKSQVFKHVLKNTKLNDANTALVIQGVGKISSDYEKGQVVKSMLSDNKLTDNNLTQVLLVTNSISSDYEKAQVMKQLLGNQTLSSQNFKQVVKVSSDVSSDYEKGGIVAYLLSNPQLAEDNFTEVLKLISDISSNYEKGKAISNLLSKLKMNEARYNALFPVITEISSDHEKGQALTRVAKMIPKDNASLVASLKKAAKTLGSDYEYRRVMEAIE
jgi:hypothetical protein